MGWLRSVVGAALLLAPNVPMRLAGQEPSAADTLLMRTIGVRDLVLGLGTVTAARAGNGRDARRWTAAGLASDSLDAMVSLVSLPAIGKRDSSSAAMLALLFVCGDIQALRQTCAPRAHT
jgi:hypothetical protein